MRLSGLRLERAQSSPQFRDGEFHNTFDVKPGLSGPRTPIMKEFLFGRAKRKPPAAIPVSSPLETWAKPPEDLRVTWLGHSTMLLEFDGVRVLTDPVFGNRLGPVSFAGPKRFHATPVSIDQLPKLDAVLISHDHYDHLCKSTIRELATRDVPFVTSLGVGMHLEAFGVPPAQIVELDWYEQHELPGGRLRFTATPSQHFSGRIGSGRNTTLWSSWVLEGPTKKLFFSGDTGLTPQFEAVHRHFGTFDLIMLEIGAWHPAWGSIHLGPTNALTAFDYLGGGTLMPVHWATWDLGLHPWAQPAEELWAQRGDRRIVTPRIGVPFTPSRIEQPEAWWREVQGASVNVNVAPVPTAPSPLITPP